VHAVVIGLALFAASLHATWNALLRSGQDRLWSVTVMSFATTAVAIPGVLLLPAPSPGCWPYLSVSAVLQVGYGFFLASAYHHGELGQVYPVIRGSVPVLVAIGAFMLVGQRLSPLGLLGIALVCGGIGSLTFGKSRTSAKALGLALATALFVASYVTADGIGVRLAGNAQSYAAWIFLAYGILMPPAFVLFGGRLSFTWRSRETAKAVSGGLLSVLSYGAILTALALGKLGPVAALRETSIVFSALLGRIVLREPLTRRRILACCIVALGAVCLGYEV